MGRGQRAREGVAEPAAGGGRARAVAAMGSLEAAQQALVASPYSRGVRVGQTLAETEHAVVVAGVPIHVAGD